MSSRRKLLPLLLVLILGMVCFAGNASAEDFDYIGSGRFASNTIAWKFNGDESDGNGSYRAPTQNAIAAWTGQTNLNLYEVSDSTWQILMTVAYYGDDGYNGYAYICAVNGQCDNDAAKNATFTYCSTRQNTFYMSGSSQARRQNLALHESGHCFSLGHRDSDGSSVMQQDIGEKTNPNGRDIQLVDGRYP